ncbi:MAG: ABC transporter ATP-binding protein [Gammaproteobacteria bacterium]|nr:ABC transporter ATP-binding protein [Gammaproteobacteria bacterium]MCY4211423.1 ABC transporter ATP-binding protein [Gammaproteobacteria bacterium]MCY4283090.1 ABC transporter ATP-binding protein [Gammaproteobacteria bacterium]MCY4338642.1 ABC transporter ATP-binding protein [Gammaproteobacteria bacterium]
MVGPVIEFRHLSKSYWEAAQEHVILDDVNGVVCAGEFVVLLGKSGCGKSTLLNLISGIDAPNCGDILVRGQSLSGMSENERTLFRRRHIGFIFQNFNLIPTLTVRDNLLLPLELTRQLDGDGWAKPAAMLGQLGLGRRLDVYPDRLSTGEQQRIAIARALIHSPDVILADEPTGNLDHDTGQEVLNLLERLVRQAGKTMIMVTHSREVIGLADRLLTIRDCRLEAG